ncbi:serine hydrolase domain-containing protein [Streptomyces sp. NPDC059906]|uniref:serine hydrolase domain-containing protein n=1 Tax=Streptomyces sp. NPDC059906 TaxID=3346997 RepID=UPI0036656BFF
MVLKVDVPMSLVHGDADEGYGAVVDAFRRNFAEGREVGAACAVYRDGAKVVDLWGGYRDGSPRQPWTENTLVPVFSTTKGVASLAVAVAHARGLLSYDAKVADYWPMFAAAGKGDVTVRQLLSHQAGLPVIDRPLQLADLAVPDVLSSALAHQRPAWTPGTRHGYHGQSLGYYESELIRRVDPQRRSLGRYFAEEVAAPLDAEFYIGLPSTVDPELIARIHGFTTFEMLLHMGRMPLPFVLAFSNPRSLAARAFSNPRDLGKVEAFNRPDVHAVEIPAANGIGEVRSIARLYGDAATGGKALGLDAATMAALTQMAPPPRDGARDQVLRVDTSYSLGYMKPFPRFRFGSSAGSAFGTMGLGGSFAFADPDTGVGFAYAMNRCGFHLWDDPREVALRDALFSTVLGEARQRPDPHRR